MMTGITKVSAFLAVFLALAFSLLLTLSLLERSVVGLLFTTEAPVAPDAIRQTFAALKLVVGVLPYTLSVKILGSFAFAIAQVIQSRAALGPVVVLVSLLVPMGYNIFLADTAAVVANLEATSPGDDIEQVKRSLLDAVQQHYIGFLGFSGALLVQCFVLLRGAKFALLTH